MTVSGFKPSAFLGGFRSVEPPPITGPTPTGPQHRAERQQLALDWAASELNLYQGANLEESTTLPNSGTCDKYMGNIPYPKEDGWTFHENYNWSDHAVSRDDRDWCGFFVGYAYQQAGIDPHLWQNFRSPEWLMDTFQQRGTGRTWVDMTTTPIPPADQIEPGDVVIFDLSHLEDGEYVRGPDGDPDHVGMVESYTVNDDGTATLVVIEGNAGPNGNTIVKNTYHLPEDSEKLVGVGRFSELDFVQDAVPVGGAPAQNGYANGSLVYPRPGMELQAGSGVNLREGPSTADSSLYITPASGAEVVVIPDSSGNTMMTDSSGRDWVYVHVSGTNRNGWMAAELLTRPPPNR